MTERFAQKARRLATRTGAVAAMVALAACSDGPEAPDPAKTASTEGAAATTDKTGGGAGLPNCSTPSEGRIFFKVADLGLAVAGNVVQDVIPANIKPPVTKEKVVAEVKTQTEQGIGCPEKPMDAGLLLVKDDLGHPLLDGSMGLLALPPGGITAGFVAETKRLQGAPTKACQQMSGSDLLACRGREKQGERVTEVLYLITMDTKQNMATGGPLAARCTFKGEAIAGCNLVETITDGVVVDVSLKSGLYTTESLRGALDKATAWITSKRVGAGT